MYGEVTITDSSWLVTLGYFIISTLWLIPLYLLTSEKYLRFHGKNSVKTLLVYIPAFFQYRLTANGVDDLYHFFNYTAWHSDGPVRLSGIVFALIYLLFMADWKAITAKKTETKENSENPSDTTTPE
ncbi:hypothetical protein [Erwinia mallotivora]|uniref:hypothetical protein n=1 Tax=Erwinia mallotivora TaxID=69222 RepID=UPI0021BFE8DF|nr:hypothetical protein [Erwinia mallotivora]